MVKAYDGENSGNSMSYLQYLQAQSSNQRLLILWDGASYHRSQTVRDFLAQVNQEQSTHQWQIHCVCFAPNCPQRSSN